MQDDSACVRVAAFAPAHERGPSMDTPVIQPESSGFHASFHIQNALPYTDISSQRCTSCMVCGKSVDEIKSIKINRYMEVSTPRSEPAYITFPRHCRLSSPSNFSTNTFQTLNSIIQNLALYHIL